MTDSATRRVQQAKARERRKQEAMAAAQEWRDEHEEVVSYLERNRFVGGKAPDSRYWNDIAYERVHDFHWALYGDPAPLTQRWYRSLANRLDKGEPVTAEPEPAQWHKLNTSVRVGRMTEAMMASDKPGAKVVVTVAIYNPQGERHLHQTFDIRPWQRPDGKLMLTTSIHDSGDFMTGQLPTTVLDCIPDEGRCEPHPSMGDDQTLLIFSAMKAVEYAFTGKVTQPGNGRIEAMEASNCGCCGRELTHPDSVPLGIGPECRGWPDQGQTVTQYYRRKAVGNGAA